MMTQSEIMAGRKYVNGIRNKNKSLYAQSLLAYMLQWSNKIPDRGELSIMGEQAVRMSLYELLPNGRKLS